MQFHKFRLSIGEIELSEEDIRLIKPQIDKAFVGLEQDEYEISTIQKKYLTSLGLKER